MTFKLRGKNAKICMVPMQSLQIARKKCETEWNNDYPWPEEPKKTKEKVLISNPFNVH